MNETRKAPDAATSQGSRKATISQSLSHSYYITILMGITTVIAGWNITGIWSGVVALLCAMVTIWMVYDYVGGLEDDSEKA